MTAALDRIICEMARWSVNVDKSCFSDRKKIRHYINLELSKNGKLNPLSLERKTLLETAWNETETLPYLNK